MQTLMAEIDGRHFMSQTRVFVSHSSKDNDWARPFAAALAAIGYDVWYDETGLQGGSAWVDSIQREVESREVFLLVLTPEAWESNWVQDELQLAIATRRRIIPVLLRNTQVSGFLLTTQWITMIGEEPQAAARAAVLAIEAPPAPGRGVAPEAAMETLEDLVVLCRSLATEKRYAEALATCARALALDPKNLSVLKIKAQVLHAIGETRLEGRTLFEILLISPNDLEFVNYITMFGSTPADRYEVLGCLFEALQDEQEVVQAYSLLDIPMKSVYAGLLTAKGRKEDARRVHEDIVRTIEKKYGNQLGRWYRPQSFSMPSEDFFPYLDSLSAIGRNKDSDRLRKAHTTQNDRRD
jgi:tetratricopeptide (TPR) repeat protein